MSPSLALADVALVFWAYPWLAIILGLFVKDSRFIKTSSLKAIKTRLKTIEDFAFDEDGTPLKVWPMNARALETVAARLTASAFVSGDRYIQAYRIESRLSFPEVTVYPALELFFKRTIKSLRTCIGVRKSDLFIPSLCVLLIQSQQVFVVYVPCVSLTHSEHYKELKYGSYSKCNLTSF